MPLKSRFGFCRPFLLLLSVLTLFGCATVKKPLTGIVPGRNVETLQSAVTLSAKSGEHSSAGRGYLVYRAPDLYHLLLLSPFGQTILEAFGDNDRFTCVIPSRQIAYSGRLSELPETSALKSLQLFKWVMAPSPLPVPAPALRQEMVLAGVTYYFDETGMLERKVSPDGDQVEYEGYRTIEGIAFPETVAISNASGAQVRIVFEEPQLNAPVENAVLSPDISGLTVLPLGEFKAM